MWFGCRSLLARACFHHRRLRLPLLSAAQSPLVTEGFDHFYNLEYPEAIADFEKAIAQDPADPQLHDHLAQTLVFQEMFRNGALESEMVSGNNSFLRRPKMNPDPRPRSGSWMRSRKRCRWRRRAWRRIQTTLRPSTRSASLRAAF